MAATPATAPANSATQSWAELYIAGEDLRVGIFVIPLQVSGGNHPRNDFPDKLHDCRRYPATAPGRRMRSELLHARFEDSVRSSGLGGSDNVLGMSEIGLETAPAGVDARCRRWRCWARARWAASCYRRFLKNNLLASDQIVATVQHEDRALALSAQSGVEVTTDNLAAATWADVILLGVKPDTGAGAGGDDSTRADEG